MRNFVLYIAATFAVANHVDSARILGLIPYTGKSHYMLIEPLVKKLAERGHQVTVASFYPSMNPPANYTNVKLSVEGAAPFELESINLTELESSNTFLKYAGLERIWREFNTLAQLDTMALSFCRQLIRFPALNEAFSKEYDLIVMEQFNSDCMLGLAYVYGIKAPVIAISTTGMMPWHAGRIGVSDNPSHVPQISRPCGMRMNFLQRLENTFLRLFYKFWFRTFIQVKEQALIEQHFGKKIPDLQDMAKNISMLFLNTHYTLHGARPSVPGLVEVGGMHLDHSDRPIPQPFSAANHADSARILGLFPHTGKSHHMVFEPLLRKLAERGHQVTVASFFPMQNPPANYTDVNLEGTAPIGLEVIDLAVFESSNKFLKYTGLERIMFELIAILPLEGMALNVCRQLVSLPALKEAFSKEYDVLLVENFNSDCMLGLAHVYGVNAPVIAFSSTGVMPWSAHRIGVSHNPSHMPLLFKPYNTAKMNFWERLENTLQLLFYKFWFRTFIQVKEQAIIEQHFGKKIPDLQDMAKNISMMILNTHYTLHGARPSVPGLVEVGGMHLDHSDRPIPQYMERFLNESEHGVVLVSFGSLIKTATISKQKEAILVNVLSKLKQRVIWKFEDSGEEGTLMGNILKVKWIPQFQLLKHHKVMAFVAHGGLLGMTESISAGKPMVVVPFFGDQPHNAAVAQEAGLGRMVPFAQLNEKDLSEALERVLSAEMRLSARRLSSIWKDRQADPMDTAIYWIERVIRWGHHSPLHSPSRDMNFIEYYLLDVLATCLVAILAVIVVLRYILMLIPRLLGISKSKKEKVH